MPVAIGLILFGFLFLLRNLGVIYGDLWKYIWPLVFIIVGFSILLRGTEKK